MLSIQHTSKLHAWVFMASLTALFWSYASQANAQQMNIQLVVENEFAISNLRAPDWGLIPTASGEVYLTADNQKAGKFTISATENTYVLLTLETPTELLSDQGDILAFAPKASFIQDGLKDARMAKPIANNQACFSLSTGNLLLNQDLFERIQELRTTVFLYGSVFAGDVEPGVYTGVVTARVEYL